MNRMPRYYEENESFELVAGGQGRDGVGVITWAWVVGVCLVGFLVFVAVRACV